MNFQNFFPEEKKRKDKVFQYKALKNCGKQIIKNITCEHMVRSKKINVHILCEIRNKEEHQYYVILKEFDEEKKMLVKPCILIKVKKQSKIGFIKGIIGMSIMVDISLKTKAKNLNYQTCINKIPVYSVHETCVYRQTYKRNGSEKTVYFVKRNKDSVYAELHETNGAFIYFLTSFRQLYDCN